jgi:hypothetical protein
MSQNLFTAPSPSQITLEIEPIYMQHHITVKRDDPVLQLPQLLDCSHWQMSLYGKHMLHATVQGLPHRSHIMQCHTLPVWHNKTLLHVDVLSIILRTCGFISTTSTNAQWESHTVSDMTYHPDCCQALCYPFVQSPFCHIQPQLTTVTCKWVMQLPKTWQKRKKF